MTVLLSYRLTLLTFYLYAMVDLDYFRKAALSFDNTTEEPHFEKISFRWKGKIFSTYWEKEHYAMVRLSPEDQSAFCAMNPGVIFPVQGTWGKQGATLVDLKKVTKKVFKDALKTAYEGVARKKK